MEIPTPGRLRGIRARDTGTAESIWTDVIERRWNPSPCEEESESIYPPSPEEVFREESRYG